MEGLIKSGAFSNIEKSRKQLLENLEYIVSTANKEAQAKELGQVSLFAGLQDSEDFAGTKFQLSGSDEEFDQRQLQNFEKEFLGFYVTSHPLSTIRDKLPFLMTHKITEIAGLPNDKVVTICGLITTARQIPTKKDPTKFIKFVTVEDLTGKIEVVCFNNKLADFGTFLEPEQRVIISGKVSKRSEEEAASIIVDSVKPVDNSNIFTIEIKDELKYEELILLKQILCAYAGSDPVILKLKDENSEVKVLTASMFWVDSCNDLVNKIEQKFKDRITVNVKSLDNTEEKAA